MRYRLSDDVSYCRVDDYLIFLDIRRDRYFRLPRALEHAFIAYMDGSSCSEIDVGRLVTNGILVNQLPPRNQATNLPVEIPLNSAIEQTSTKLELRPGQLLETASITVSMQWQLRTRALKSVLAAVFGYRERHANQKAPRIAGASLRQDLIDAAAIFRRARLYVPVDTSCLLDSAAMVKFLAQRGLYASIVFGVACDPFSAHCWVQTGDLVLNDTVGNAQLYTPIRIV